MNVDGLRCHSVQSGLRLLCSVSERARKLVWPVVAQLACIRLCELRVSRRAMASLRAQHGAACSGANAACVARSTQQKAPRRRWGALCGAMPGALDLDTVHCLELSRCMSSVPCRTHAAPTPRTLRLMGRAVGGRPSALSSMPFPRAHRTSAFTRRGSGVWEALSKGCEALVGTALDDDLAVEVLIDLCVNELRDRLEVANKDMECRGVGEEVDSFIARNLASPCGAFFPFPPPPARAIATTLLVDSSEDLRCVLKMGEVGMQASTMAEASRGRTSSGHCECKARDAEMLWQVMSQDTTKTCQVIAAEVTKQAQHAHERRVPKNRREEGRR